MGHVSMRDLPKWSSTRRGTAKTCLPSSASNETIDALARSLNLGYQYGLSTPQKRSTPLLAIYQGRYSHQALDEQLGSLPSTHEVHRLQVEVPTPPLKNLEVDAGVYHLEGRMVLVDDELSQVHLYLAHGSMSRFPSPHNEGRFRMGVGIVSRMFRFAVADPQDFGINLIMTAAGLSVPPLAIGLYARSNLTSDLGLISVFGLMSVFPPSSEG